jgi:LuxR family maltose regulon positive regulatory protein
MATEKTQPLIDAGKAAMHRADWEKAVAAFREASSMQESAEVLEYLGWSAWWLNDAALSFDALERAYQLYSAQQNRRGAARTAVWLARARMEFRGEHAVANGWLQRAHSHLEGLEDSPELGWLLLFEGHLALMGKKETEIARSLARQAIAIGKNFREADIEMWGRALDGLALVIAGDVSAGMQQLDEAAAIGVAAEAKDLNAIGATCCYLIHACERVQDHERAEQWYARTREICRRWRFSALVAVCRAQYASLLISRGAWKEAEAELQSAREELKQYRPSLLPMCDLRIAELRRRQGRFDDATQLFSQMESHPVSLLGRGLIALDRGDATTALELAERYLRRVPANDRIERVPGMELLLRAKIALKQLDDASATVGELLSIAAMIPIDPIRAAVSFAAGLLSFHSDELETSRQQFEDALDLYHRANMGYDEARARLYLARVLRELDRAEQARSEAQRAADAFGKLGAVFDEELCLEFLRSLVPRTALSVLDALRQAGMTRREAEVLMLIADGKTNDEIAGQLYLSIRTVERHISTIYQKLGVSGKSARAAAASYAVKAGISTSS